MPPREGWRAAERERRSQPASYCLCCSAACRPRVDAGWCGMSILDLRLCHCVVNMWAYMYVLFLCTLYVLSLLLC